MKLQEFERTVAEMARVAAADADPVDVLGVPGKCRCCKRRGHKVAPLLKVCRDCYHGCSDLPRGVCMRRLRA